MGWFTSKRRTEATKLKGKDESPGNSPPKTAIPLTPREYLGESGSALRQRINQHIALEGVQIAAFVLLRLSQQKDQWSSMPRNVWAKEIAKLLPYAPVGPEDIRKIISQTITQKWAVKNGKGFAATNHLAMMVAVPMADAENGDYGLVADSDEVIIIDEQETTELLTT